MTLSSLPAVTLFLSFLLLFLLGGPSSALEAFFVHSTNLPIGVVARFISVAFLILFSFHASKPKLVVYLSLSTVPFLLLVQPAFALDNVSFVLLLLLITRRRTPSFLDAMNIVSGIFSLYILVIILSILPLYYLYSFERAPIQSLCMYPSLLDSFNVTDESTGRRLLAFCPPALASISRAFMGVPIFRLSGYYIEPHNLGITYLLVLVYSLQSYQTSTYSSRPLFLLAKRTSCLLLAIPIYASFSFSVLLPFSFFSLFICRFFWSRSFLGLGLQLSRAVLALNSFISIYFLYATGRLGIIQLTLIVALFIFASLFYPFLGRLSKAAPLWPRNVSMPYPELSLVIAIVYSCKHLASPQFFYLPTFLPVILTFLNAKHNKNVCA